MKCRSAASNLGISDDGNLFETATLVYANYEILHRVVMIIPAKSRIACSSSNSIIRVSKASTDVAAKEIINTGTVPFGVTTEYFGSSEQIVRRYLEITRLLLAKQNVQQENEWLHTGHP